jgi:hypothetical protein
MCHKKTAGKICSEKCQDTARRMTYMGKMLGEIWDKKILEIWRIINRMDQNNCEKCLNKIFQENDDVGEM